MKGTAFCSKEKNSKTKAALIIFVLLDFEN